MLYKKKKEIKVHLDQPVFQGDKLAFGGRASLIHRDFYQVPVTEERGRVEQAKK